MRERGTVLADSQSMRRHSALQRRVGRKRRNVQSARVRNLHANRPSAETCLFPASSSLSFSKSCKINIYRSRWLSRIYRCPENWFRCAYGACIRPELKCNIQLNCHDWSDEEEYLCGMTLPEGACRLPPAKPGTHYSISGCSRCRPGEIVPQFTRLDYTCDTEDSLQGPSEVYCRSNRWSPVLPSCIAGKLSLSSAQQLTKRQCDKSLSGNCLQNLDAQFDICYQIS